MSESDPLQREVEDIVSHLEAAVAGLRDLLTELVRRTDQDG